MNYELYFPRGLATGSAFCNRKNERARLATNIKSGQHTLLMSPRRYGKTSLVFYVANEVGLPFGEVDLFIATDAKKIEYSIISGIKKIIANIGTSTEQILEILRNYFKDKSARWIVGTQGLNITLIADQNSDPATNIQEALQALDDLLQKKDKRAILFLDEMQEIGEIAGGSGIEGVIRHIAQKTKHLSLVFSGSNRRLLAKMFYDKSRPLYKLCDRILLDRIDKNEYVDHINEFVVQQCGGSVDLAVLDTIFKLTELHPYYVNNLCLNLWRFGVGVNTMPNDVINCWNKIIQEERSETLRELSMLSIGQRKILTIIANGQIDGLTGKKTLKEVDLSSSAVIEALKVLEQKDYIEETTASSYKMIDPLIKSTILFYANYVW